MSGEIRTTSFAVKSKLFRNCCIRRPLRWLSDGAAVRVRWCGGGLLSGSNVVPWTSWNEWNLVRESLFSSSPATALDRIMAWRGKGFIPAITASLIEIQQKDPFFYVLNFPFS
ncbi:unnamed protein product [Rhodiola kirilowii]